MSRLSNSRPATARTSRPILFGAVFLLAVCPLAAAADPSRTIPAKDLAFYVEYDGLDAHADAWKATAVHAMFERTPAGAMTADIARQIVDHLLKAVSDQKEGGANLIALQKHILRHGFSLGVYDEGERGASCIVAFSLLGRKEGREQVGRLAEIVTRTMSNTDGKVTETCRFQGRDIYRVKQPTPAIPIAEVPHAAGAPKAATAIPAASLAWWFEGNDLIVVAGPTPPKADDAKNGALAGLPVRVSLVIDTIEGKASSATTHPGRASALLEGKDIKGFESDGLFFFEVNKAQGLYAWFSEVIDRIDQPNEGLTLPSAKYMTDDVQYFPAGPEIPSARSSVAEARQKGATIPAPLPQLAPPPSLAGGPPAASSDIRSSPLQPDTAKAKSPAAEAPPKLAPLPPPPRPPIPAEPLGKTPAALDPAVSKTGIVSGRKPDPPKMTDATVAKSLGLDGIRRVVGRWGFQGKALLTDVRVEAPAPRRGLVAMLDQPSFRKDRLPPIPRGTGAFLIGSCDPVKVYDALVSLSSDLGGGAEAVDLISHEIELLVFEETGQRLHEDILGHFGPAWCLYAEPESKTDIDVPTLLVEVDDAKAFGKVLDALAKRLNARFGNPRKEKDVKPSDEPPLFALERLPMPERGYRLTSPAAIISWLGGGLQPTILVGDSHVAIAANVTLAHAALAAASRPAERWAPSGELAEAFACLPAEMTSLTVGEPRDSSWPAMVVALPKLVQHIASSMEVVKGDQPGSPGSKFLGLLGVPQAGGFRLRIDPANRPKADELKAQLFPSVTAAAVDDRGIRLIAREAIPFACAGPMIRYNGSTNSGETVTVELRPFLFPCARLVVKHNSNKPGGTFSFGMNWKFTDDDESNE